MWRCYFNHGIILKRRVVDVVKQIEVAVENVKKKRKRVVFYFAEILPETQLDFYKQKAKSKKNVLASGGSGKDITEGDVTSFDADKFLEDVK